MSSANDDYSAPTVSEYSLDPGGNYASPSESVGDVDGPGILGSGGE